MMFGSWKHTHKKNTQFQGVLNSGVVMQTILFLSIGILGYWKYGELTEAPLTQNLPNEALAQSVFLILVIGVTLGYAIQFYIPIEIMFPSIRRRIRFADRNPLVGELLFRLVMVLGRFTQFALA